MTAIEVLALGAKHLREYRALMLHAYAHAADAFTSTAAERAAKPEAWWLDRLADPTGLTIAFGCIADGGLVGTVTVECAAREKTRHKASILGMYVLPEARGRGAARALLQAAVSHCRARPGLALVQLTVTDGNEPAIALYRSFGFEDFGLEPMAIRSDGRYFAKRHMWLRLADGTAGPG